MYELIMQYGPYAVLLIGYLAPVLPYLHKRVVQDKNIMTAFNGIKELASKVVLKESDITASIGKINQIALVLNDKVDKKIAELDEKIVQVDRSITNFMSSELYQRMLTGLDTLKDLDQMLQNKDTSIQDIGLVLKEFKTELISIKQRIG
jgi:hypothetical protein